MHWSITGRNLCSRSSIRAIRNMIFGETIRSLPGFLLSWVPVIRTLLPAVIDQCIEIVLILAGRKVIPQICYLITQIRHLLIIFRMIRSQRQINICQHGQSCIFAGTSHVLVVVRRLGRKQVNRILTIGNYLGISLLDCSACNVCRFSRIIRSQTQWNTTVQTYQYIVIMCTEKISLSQTAVLDFL